MQKIKIVALLGAILVVTGCSSEYEKMVSRELSSGVQNDSLFLGINFGMSQKDFYAHCWELNKQQKIYQGSGNLSVRYRLKDELKYPAKMEFYPKFANDTIWNMPVLYTYEAWSPPPSPFSGDSLQLDLLNKYEKWYGDGFLKISHPEYGDAYVKVDGNRQISIFKVDPVSVKVIFKDLSNPAESR